MNDFVWFRCILHFKNSLHCKTIIAGLHSSVFLQTTDTVTSLQLPPIQKLFHSSHFLLCHCCPCRVVTSRKRCLLTRSVHPEVAKSKISWCEENGK